MAISSGSQIEELLGDEAESLLSYQASGIDAAQIVAPGPDFIDRVVVPDRPHAAGAAEPGAR